MPCSSASLLSLVGLVSMKMSEASIDSRHLEAACHSTYHLNSALTYMRKLPNILVIHYNAMHHSNLEQTFEETVLCNDADESY